MTYFQDMTVRRSWSLVLAAFSALLLLAGGLGLYSNQVGRDAFGILQRLNVEQASVLQKAYIDVLRARTEMDRAAELMRVPSFERPGPALERAEGWMHGADEAFQAFLASPIASHRADAVDELRQRYQSLVNNNLRLQLLLLQDGDHAGYRSGQSRVAEASHAFIAVADAFLADSATAGHALVERFERHSRWLAWGMLAALGVAAALIAVVMWGMTVNVIRPLRRVIEHFRRIAEGDLATPVESRGSNEIGQLYAELATMQRSLIGMVDHLHAGSDGVHADSRDMAELNHSLAAQTQQQAAALEQTSASLEQLTAAVTSNADNARRVGESADDASRRAREGEAVIRRFVATMEEIHGQSEAIAKVVELIESIAFQTNLLALNASVEAARAGEQGRGFAVVAKEVRELASRSAASAAEVRQRVQASHDRVAEGKALSGVAARHTQDILSAIQRVDALMGQIVQASEEQRLGIEEVNRAMAQMTSATQASTRLVESAAAGAGRLERQAERMRGQARGFALATSG